MGAYVTLSDSDFQDTVLKADKLVLVDFWAQWCGPCKIVGPIVEELAEEYKDKVVVAKMDVDANQQVPGAYNVMSIPTLMFFKGGQVVKTLIGAQPKEVLKQTLDSLLH